MNVVVLIDGREAIPVRAIPFVTGWKVSPDALVMSLGHTAECIRLERLTAHQLLPGGSHAAVLPREWDGVGSDLVALSKELQAESDDCDVTKPVWRRQSIRLLPGGVFVWKDEFEESFRRAYDPASPTGPLLIDEPRAGDLDLTFTPMIPEELRHEILAGFRCDADGRRMTVADLLASQTGHFISLREVLTRMTADGTNRRDSARALYRLLQDNGSQQPEWVAEGLEGLWILEDEDLSRARRLLEKAARSGRCDGRKFKETGFFVGEITAFLAKHGLDIARDPRSTTTTAAGIHRPRMCEPETPLHVLSRPHQPDDKEHHGAAELTIAARDPADNAEETEPIAVTSDHDADLASLFDPVPVAALEKMFPCEGRWANYAQRAARHPELLAARAARARFNPYLAARWWFSLGQHGWDWARCLRVLANNLPPRSKDSKQLLTGDFD